MVGRPLVNYLVTVFNLGQRRILKHRGVGNQPVLNRLRINRYRLNRRTGLPFCHRCVVKYAVAHLLPSASRNAQHASVGIHNNHRGLRRFLVCDIGERLVVGILFVENRLNAGVYGGIDAVTAAVYLGRRLTTGHALLRHKVGDYLFDHMVDKVALGGVELLHRLFFFEGEGLRLLHRLLILRVGNTPLLVHLVQDVLPPFFIVFSAFFSERVEFSGILRNGGNTRAFGNGQLADILAEVQVCRGLYAVSIVCKTDGVQVRLQNIIFGVHLLHINGAKNLLNLSGDGHIVLAGDVLYQLLRNCRAALLTLPGKITKCNGCGSPPVHTGMGGVHLIVIPFVLNGNKRLSGMFRYLLNTHPDAVFSANQALQLVGLARFGVLGVDDAGIVLLKVP